MTATTQSPKLIEFQFYQHFIQQHNNPFNYHSKNLINRERKQGCTCGTMSKMTLIAKGAIPCHLPLIANPGFPIRGLRIRPIPSSISTTITTTGTTTNTAAAAAAAAAAATVTTRAQTYSNTLAILRLLIVKKGATISIGAPFLRVKLLTMPSLVGPLHHFP